MWADVSLLESLPNGGAVVAIIVVVVLFLRKQEKQEEMVQHVVETFTAEITATRKDYLDHLTGIMNQGLAAHKETRDAIRRGDLRADDEKRV